MGSDFYGVGTESYIAFHCDSVKTVFYFNSLGEFRAIKEEISRVLEQAGEAMQKEICEEYRGAQDYGDMPTYPKD